MFFSTSLTVIGLTLSTLLLSASASPRLHGRGPSNSMKYNLICPPRTPDSPIACSAYQAICLDDGTASAPPGYDVDKCGKCTCEQSPTAVNPGGPASVQSAPSESSSSAPPNFGGDIPPRGGTSIKTFQLHCPPNMDGSCRKDPINCSLNGDVSYPPAYDDQKCGRVCSCELVSETTLGQAAQRNPAPVNPPAAPGPPPPLPASSTLTCSGTIKVNPNVPEGTLPIENQDWCTRAEVDATCDNGVVKVVGLDKFNICKINCKCE